MHDLKLVLGIGIAIILLLTTGGLLYLRSKSPENPMPQAIRASDGSSFIVIPSYEDNEIYEIYERLKEEGTPPFITSDLVLHTAHLLFDYSLRAVELEVLYPKITKLSTALVREANKLDSAAMSSQVREVARGLTAYCSVGAKILDPEFDIPAALKQEVKADLNLIEQHKGFALSKTLPHMEDFSQYVPRGHYTRSQLFEQYFKAMMWFGRRLFRVEEKTPEGIPGGDLWNDEMMLRETRQMLLATYLLENTYIGSSPAIDLWDDIYETTALFSGKTEDLNVHQVQEVAKKVWGKTPIPSDLVDEGKIRQFIALAREATHPKIDASGAGRKGFSLLAQRFLPDSYIMQSLVSTRGSLKYIGDREPRPFTFGVVIAYGPARTFPRGLDVFAALGSDEALQVLNESGDTAYEGYQEKMSALREELPEMINKGKDESLFYGLLHTLLALLEVPEGEFLPGIFSTRAWTLKELNAALGSWAEIRHDTILYAKQSYTAVGAARVSPTMPPGYVEPYPEFYRQIQKMVSNIYAKCIKTTANLRELESNFKEFDAVMERLIEISEKELEEGVLNEKDYQDISEAALRLKSTTQFPSRIMKKITADVDSKMAAIADVHTDSNSQMVLEEAVGTPFQVQVEIKIGSNMIALTGGVFSYYEFKHPMKDRLTDEKWQEKLLKESERPPLPEWFYNIFH